MFNIYEIDFAMVFSGQILPDRFIPLFEVGNLQLIRNAFFLKEPMQQKFCPTLVHLPHKLVTNQHRTVAMNHIKTGGKDKERPELDRYVKVEPITTPNSLGRA